MLDPECFSYYPDFVDPDCADHCLDVLWRELRWQQREIVLFGRRVMQPRLVAWYGDPSAVYSYSGLRLEPEPWHGELAGLRDRLEDFTGTRFNSVLANAYRNGSDSMGWHRDDEPELGPEPLIASLSFGAPRRFLVRRSAAGRRPGPSEKLTLCHGSLLLMRRGCQDRYQHALPKTRRPVGLRVNLTFREIRG